MNYEFYDRIGLFLGYYKKPFDVKSETKVTNQEIQEGYTDLKKRLEIIQSLVNECFVDQNTEAYQHFVGKLKYTVDINLFNSHLNSFIELMEKFNDAHLPVSAQSYTSIPNGRTLFLKKIAARDPYSKLKISYVTLFDTRSDLTYIKNIFENILSKYQGKLTGGVEKENTSSLAQGIAFCQSYLLHGTVTSEAGIHAHDKINDFCLNYFYLLQLEKNIQTFLLPPDKMK